MHEGHRKRMLDRLNECDSLYDHELLEMLMYFVCRVKDTNPVGHSLLERFGSLSELLRADIDELKSVEDVGDAAASLIKLVGVIAERAGKIEGTAELKTLGDCKQFISMRFRGKTEEYLELYFLAKSGKLKRLYRYTSADRNKVSVDGGDIIKNIAIVKPYAILAAHNHLNGCTEPSENDEVFTNLLQLICQMNGVIFIDHMIYDGDEGFYSYRDSGSLENISARYSMGSILKWIKNSSST